MAYIGINPEAIIGLADDDIRQLVMQKLKNTNGEYIICVCRQCGLVRWDEHGNWRTMEIMDNCSRCPEEKSDE